MESDIKIKCTQEEMEQFFDDGANVSVRHYDMINPNLFKCRIRHKELEKPLNGTYTLKYITDKFK